MAMTPINKYKHLMVSRELHETITRIAKEEERSIVKVTNRLLQKGLEQEEKD